MANVVLYQNDSAPEISDTITYTGSPTLTGSTVTFTMKDSAGTKKIDARACTVVIDDVAKTIVWTVDMTASDTDTIAEYDAWVQVTYPDSDVQSILAGTVTVLEGV